MQALGHHDLRWVRQRDSGSATPDDAVIVGHAVVFNPGHNGGPVLALMLISPAGPGRLAVLVPLERHICVAHKALAQVFPAVVEVLQIRLHGRLVGLVVEELVEGVFGRILFGGGYSNGQLWPNTDPGGGADGVCRASVEN